LFVNVYTLKVVPNGALLTFNPNPVISPIFNVTHTTKILPIIFLFDRRVSTYGV